MKAHSYKTGYNAFEIFSEGGFVVKPDWRSWLQALKSQGFCAAVVRTPWPAVAKRGIVLQPASARDEASEQSPSFK